MAEFQIIEIRINADDLDRFEKAFTTADRISIDAVEAVVTWALDNMPSLEIIAACDRVLWWIDMQRKKASNTEGKVSDAHE